MTCCKDEACLGMDPVQWAFTHINFLASLEAPLRASTSGGVRFAVMDLLLHS